MGQAIKRGTFEQRQSSAIEDETLLTYDRSEHINKLSDMETMSVKQSEKFAAQIIVSHWKHSNISRRIPSSCNLDEKLFVVSNNYKEPA